ncbi:MAG: glutamate--tRNA ligase, partial [Bacilli bacterium]|nr:glutamate--tRNA ligase [Bacilli bacterium]
PSPTGFIHIGALLASFIASSFSKQTNGVVILRIEDTDTKRTMDNGIEIIINGLREYGVIFDEGPISENEEIGSYGPYIQSNRKEIYHAFVKYLLEEGKAYPCFCSEEELETTRNMQTQARERIGYYGKWAKCRNNSIEESYNRIKNNEPFVIRFKSPGDFNKIMTYTDVIKGNIEMPENDLDIVIMKSDGLPTYHFAHLVDDHLMRTTHVIRADEWVPSVPIHIQLFEAFNFEKPYFCHISPLLKNDEGSIRKLSKRKDPECAMSFYHELGVPNESVLLYLATIANSDFEEWYLKNKDKNISDFTFTFDKIGKSGALFDIEKLKNISKEFISTLKANDLYDRVADYLLKYDNEFYQIFTKDKDYSIKILNIQREVEKPRKDLTHYGGVKNEYIYMYDELYDKLEKHYIYPYITDKEEVKCILKVYIDKYYDQNDNQEDWFNKIKDLSQEFGYAREVKDFKNNQSMYKGHVGDVSTILRIALTSRDKTIDLYSIMQLLGKNRIEDRYNKIIDE